MKRAGIVLLSGIWSLAPLGAHARWDGPFGTEEGLTVQQLAMEVSGWTVEGPDNYTFLEAPRHFPGVTRYRVTLPASTGLCRIVAEFPVAQSNSFGDEVKTTIAHLQRALAQRYGPPTRHVDELDPKAVNSQDSDWMAALQLAERRYGVFWEGANGKSARQYPGKVATLSLTAVPETNAQARVELAYEFENFVQCSSGEGAESRKH